MTYQIYKTGDIDHIQEQEKDAMDPQFKASIDIIAKNNPTWTFYSEDRMIAVGGLLSKYAGVAEIWAIVDERAKGSGFELYKDATFLIKLMEESMSLRRIGALVKSHLTENRRWIELLGFEVECIMKYASPEGTDMIGYVKCHHPAQHQT